MDRGRANRMSLRGRLLDPQTAVQTLLGTRVHRQPLYRSLDPLAPSARSFTAHRPYARIILPPPLQVPRPRVVVILPPRNLEVAPPHWNRPDSSRRSCARRRRDLDCRHALWLAMRAVIQATGRHITQARCRAERRGRPRCLRTWLRIRHRPAQNLAGPTSRRPVKRLLVRRRRFVLTQPTTQRQLSYAHNRSLARIFNLNLKRKHRHASRRSQLRAALSPLAQPPRSPPSPRTVSGTSSSRRCRRPRRCARFR